MKTKLTQYRERIARIRYYLSKLSGGGESPEQLKYAALITYELNRLPYQPPRPKRSILTRIMTPFLGGRNTNK